MTGKKTVVIGNPLAGRGDAIECARAIARELELNGIAVEIQNVLESPSERREPHADLRRALLEGSCDNIVICGGDGTVNRVLNEMSQSGCWEPVVSVFPCGTCNEFAKSLGMQDHVESLAASLVAGRLRRVDLIRLNGSTLCTVVACGFDSAVNRFVARHLQRSRGRWAYALGSLVLAASFRAFRAEVLVDEELVGRNILMCAIANTASYGGGFRISPNSRIDDGLLDVCLVSDRGFFGRMGLLVKVMRGAHLNDDGIQLLRGRRVCVSCDAEIELWADGEYFGTCPADLELLPNVLAVSIQERECCGPVRGRDTACSL